MRELERGCASRSEPRLAPSTIVYAIGSALMRLFRLLTVCAFAVFTGSDPSGGRVNPPAISPPEMAKSVLAEFDANHNDALDGEELSHCPGLRSSLSLSDANRDGKLTADEISGRFQSFLGARI